MKYIKPQMAINQINLKTTLKSQIKLKKKPNPIIKISLSG